MIVAAQRLNDAQVVNIAISVQIQVGQHIRRVIQQLLKFGYRTRLRKGSSHGLQIQIERYILGNSRHAGRRDSLYLRSGNRRGVGRQQGRLGDHCGRLDRGWRHGHNTGKAATQQAGQQCRSQKLFFHFMYGLLYKTLFSAAKILLFFEICK